MSSLGAFNFFTLCLFSKTQDFKYTGHKGESLLSEFFRFLSFFLDGIYFFVPADLFCLLQVHSSAAEADPQVFDVVASGLQLVAAQRVCVEDDTSGHQQTDVCRKTLQQK